MRSKRALLVFLIGASTLVSGCSSLGLRKDWYQEQQAQTPVAGGRWTERGLLAEDPPYGVGRNPASDPGSDGLMRVGGAWDSPGMQEAARRDQYRNWGDENEMGPSYQQQPNMNPQINRQYKNGMRATRADFVDDVQNDGSLWASDGQTNYYFTKNKIRSVGDIVTIQLEDGIIKDVGSEIKRTLSREEFDLEIKLAQERLKTQAEGQQPQGGAQAARAPAGGASPTAAASPTAQTEVEVRDATPADIDVNQSLEIKKGDTVIAEIVQRYPNGNFKVRGTKKVQYKSGTPRLLEVVAIAKGADISEEDTISSGKLYEYRLEALR